MGVRLLRTEASPLGSVLVVVCSDGASHVEAGACPLDFSETWSRLDGDETDTQFSARVRREMKALGAERVRGAGTVPTTLRNLVGKDL